MMMSLCHLKWGLFNENIYANVNVDFTRLLSNYGNENKVNFHNN